MSEEHTEEQASPEVPETGFEFDADLEPDDLGFGTPEVRDIRIGDTLVDMTVQRKLDNGRVNDMIAKFSRHAIGVITVNRRNAAEVPA